MNISLLVAFQITLKKLPILLVAVYTTSIVGCKQTGDQTAVKKASQTAATTSASYSSNTSAISFRTSKKPACCKGAPSRSKLFAQQKKE